MGISAIVLLFAVLGPASESATAADCRGESACCDRCGCHAACVRKTCQVVCGVKKEAKTSWSVKCEEFCPLMPGCHHGCDECQPLPRCGHPKCVKKLVKKEYEVEVPIYKCVVRNLCSNCCRGESPETPEPPAAPPQRLALPPPPDSPAPSPPAPPPSPK